MDMILLHITTGFLYALASVFVWRRIIGKKRQDKAERDNRRSVYFLPAFAIFLHFVITQDYAFKIDGLHLGIGNIVSFVVLAICVTYAMYGLKTGSYSLLAICLPVGLVASALPILDSGLTRPIDANLFIFKTHLSLSIIAYSMFSVAFIHTLLIGFIEQSIQRHRLSAFVEEAPPLLELERLMFYITLFGFIVLSLALGTGIIFSFELQNNAFSWNHKTIFSITSWCMFATLLLGRKYFGWRGKTARKLLTTSFSLLLLSYLGTRFVSEVLLQST